PIQVGQFTRQAMVRSDRFERFGGEGEIHVVARLALKINNKSAENSVHRRNPPNTPTAMDAVAALGQAHERLQVVPSDFSAGHKLLELFSHRINFKCTLASRRIANIFNECPPKNQEKLPSPPCTVGNERRITSKRFSRGSLRSRRC